MAKDSRRAEPLQLPEQLRQWLDSPEQRALRDQFKHVCESPHWRALQEQMRRLAELPSFRRQQQQLQELARQLRAWQQPPKPTPKPKSKKKGAGAKPKLNSEQIAKLQQEYRHALKRDQALRKNEAALAFLRPLLSETVSNATLLRRIVRPVRVEDSK
jgi:hypothetical protein